jgi:hypothetical protein
VGPTNVQPRLRRSRLSAADASVVLIPLRARRVMRWPLRRGRAHSQK